MARKKWISVSEGLPKTEYYAGMRCSCCVNVIVADSEGNADVYVACYMENVRNMPDGWYYMTPDDSDLKPIEKGVVTHWAPLPEMLDAGAVRKEYLKQVQEKYCGTGAQNNT